MKKLILILLIASSCMVNVEKTISGTHYANYVEINNKTYKANSSFIVVDQLYNNTYSIKTFHEGKKESLSMIKTKKSKWLIEGFQNDSKIFEYHLNNDKWFFDDSIIKLKN
jgi:hypothetical protein